MNYRQLLFPERLIHHAKDRLAFKTSRLRQILMLAVFLIGSMSVGQAQTYTVTSTADDGSVGTLDWAITQADANAGSTINIADNLGTIVLTSALPSITAAVTINGGIGDSVSGNNANRIFFVDTTTAGAAVNINNLGLINGYAKGADGGASAGGALGAGGAIYVNSGAATLSGVALTGNTAQGGNGGSGTITSVGGGGSGGAAIDGSVAQGANSGGGEYGTPAQNGNYGGGGGGSLSFYSYPIIISVIPGTGGFGGGGGGGYDHDGYNDGININDGNGAGSVAFGGTGGNYHTATSGQYQIWQYGDASGGGGAALGGSIFVNATNGASLSFSNYTTDAGTVIAGLGGPLDADFGLLTGTAAINGQAVGSTLFVDGGTTELGDGTIAGSIAAYDEGTFVKNGTGLLTVVGGINTYDGAMVVNAGTLQIGNGTGTARLAGNVTDSGTVVFNGTGSLTYSDSISGSGSVSNTGTMNLILTGTNTFTGGLLNSGTVQLGNGGTSGSISSDVTNNGSLIFNRSDTVTAGYVISGSGSVTQAGTGNVVLTGNNTYTGGTMIPSGTLSISSDANLGDLSGALTINGGTLDSTANFTSSRNIVLGSRGGNFGGTGNMTVDGTISGTGALTKTDSNILTLAGTQTYTGATRILSGTLELAANGASPSALTSSSVTIAGGASLLFLDPQTYAGTITGTATSLVGFQSTGTTTLTGNVSTGSIHIDNGTLQVGAGSTAGSISGNVVDNSALVFNRSGSLSYGGNISGSGSVFDVGSGTTTVSGTLSGIASVSNTGTGTFILNGAVNGVNSVTNSKAGTLTINGAINGGSSLSNVGTGTLAVNGAISGGASLFNLGTGTLSIGGDLTGISSLANNGGGKVSLTGNVTSNFNISTPTGSTLDFSTTGNATFNGVLSGAGKLTVTSGHVALTAANTNSGGIYINGGTLAVSNDANLGDASNIIALSGTLQAASAFTSSRTLTASGSNGTLDTNGNNVTFASFQGSISDTFTKTGEGTLTLTSNSSVGTALLHQGTTAFATGTGITASNLEVGYLNPYINDPSMTSANLTIDGSGSFLNSTGTMANGGGVYVGSNESGNLTLSNHATATVNLLDVGRGDYSGDTNGTVLVESGSTFSSQTTYIGGDSFDGTTYPDVTGSLRVTGAGSTFTTNNLYLGGSGTGTVIVDNGGTVVVQGAVSVEDPNYNFGVATLELDGTSAARGTARIGSFNGFNAQDDIPDGYIQSQINFNGGVLQAGGNNSAFVTNSVITVNDAGGTIDSNGHNIAINSDTLITGTGVLNKIGAGTLAITGNNNYTGGTNLVAGTLNVGSKNAIGTTGTISFNGGTLQYGAGNQTDYSSRFSTAANQQYKIDTNGQNVALATSLSSSGGSLTKQGSGSLSLTGSNTYTGATTIAGGTLVLGQSTAPTMLLNAQSGVVTDGSGNVTGWTDQSGNGNNASALSGAHVTVGTLNGKPTLIFSAGSALSDPLSGSSSAYTIFAVIDPTGTSGNQTLLGSAVNGNIQFRLNDNRLDLLEQGVADLGSSSGSVTAGTPVIVGGTITDGSQAFYIGGSAAGTNSSGYSPGSNSTTIIGSNAGRNENFTGDISAIVVYDSVLTSDQITQIQSYLNTAYFGGSGGSLYFSQAGSLPTNTAVNITNSGAALDVYGLHQTIGSLTGVAGTSVYLGGGALTVGNDNTSTTFAGVISDSGGQISATGGSLTKIGTGTLTLTGNNLYSGGTMVEGGTLQIGNGGTTGSITGNVALSNDSTLAFDRSDDITFGGNITGNGSVDKMGANTLTLSGTNSYNGGTKVEGGNVIMTGSITGSVSVSSGTFNLKSGSSLNGDASVGSGGTLGGKGTINGNIVVQNGGTLWPGDPSVTTVSGSVTLNTGSTAAFSIANTATSDAPRKVTAGTDYDQVSIQSGNNLTIQSGATLQINSVESLQLNSVAYVPTGPNTGLDNYFVFTLQGGTTTGQFDFLSDGTTSVVITYLNGIGSATIDNTIFYISNTGNFATNSTLGGQDVVISAYAAVPEPGTWLLMITGGLGIWFVRRFLKRATA